MKKVQKWQKNMQKACLRFCSVEEYKERVKLFLEYISPDIWIQRLLGRAPEEDTFFKLGAELVENTR